MSHYIHGIYNLFIISFYLLNKQVNKVKMILSLEFVGIAAQHEQLKVQLCPTQQHLQQPSLCSICPSF